MSALYFSISRDQACSLPDRHSLTRRVSVHATACFFGAVSITGRRSLLHYAGKAGRHSRAHMVPAQRDGSYQLYSLLPPECRDWREKSWVDFPPESPAHGHRVSSVVHCLSPSVARPCGDGSPLLRAWPGATAKDSRGVCRRSTAIH